MSAKVTHSMCGRNAALFTFAAIATFAVSANAATVETNGVSWAYTVNDETRRTVTWIQGSTPLAGTSTVDASLIPWTFTNPGDGQEYTVTAIGENAFKSSAWLIGELTIPDAVTSIGASAFLHESQTATLTKVVLGRGITVIASYAFKYQTGLTSVLVKGNVTDINAQAFGWDSALRNIVFANSDMNRTIGTQFLNGLSGINIFIPQAAGLSHSGLISANTIIHYGSSQELDMTFDDTTVTMFPTTESSLTNALAWAVDPFSNEYGFGTAMAITNRIDMTATVTEEMLQTVTLDAPPWYMTFKVTSQSQLDYVLDAVSTDIPIIIDIDGVGKNDITVPEGRQVAILAKSGWTFGRQKTGLVIIFR